MESIIDNNNIKKEQLRCFVCEADVQGRYYYLATCKTQSSRSKVIEKLGELVGERYMVVISEDDVICRSCANHINALDRLEVEMRNVRSHVLRFLEQKYCLEKGELLGNSDRPRPSQPPQITKCNTTEIIGNCIKQSEVDSEIHSYTRDQQQQQHQQLKQSQLLLECDKCKYTTHLDSFMMHHIKDYVKQKEFCNKCGLRVPGDQEEVLHSCKTIAGQSGNNYDKDNSTITGEDSIDVSLFHKMTRQLLPVQITQNAPPLLIDASNCEYISSTLLPGGNDKVMQLVVNYCEHISSNNVFAVEDNFPVSSKQQIPSFYPVEMSTVVMDVSSGKMTRISEKI